MDDTTGVFGSRCAQYLMPQALMNPPGPPRRTGPRVQNNLVQQKNNLVQQNLPYGEYLLLSFQLVKS